ncbi:M48 family metalloprotease [Salinisphaera hydrothermalis]|uniref:Peptidase M48 Ste24p n=1 Tax=Salinisphaera hydrothermalis (strain C41B8) TaxID=1304275 RepID=A0A084IHQ7_SALHC|nr:M48 family metalloprotease [Salinisphaera hydrothermalis]KEZ76241.1 peptidase M48 Ste24p [Salinisphaera hydrothermalis C41B8]
MRISRAAIAGMILLASTSAVAGPAGAAGDSDGDYNLPDLGQPADTAMTPTEEKRLGAQVVAQLRSQNQIIEDPELSEYLNSVGRRLASHTDRPAKDFHFYVIDTDEINAFALPGGYIGVNSGLITATKSESELASVMAHEIAHVTQRHIARQMVESRGDTIATLATAIVAAIAGAQAGGGGDAATAAILGGMSHLGMQQLSYTRANEFEADRVGIRDLARSGYDPHAMARFFGTLERQSDLYGQQPPQILLSHPVTSTRIAEANARAADYPNVKVHTNPEYPYMRARARILEAQSADDVRDYFRGKLQGDHPIPADNYGYALALSRLSQDKHAIALMQAGLKAHPDILAWHMGLADVLARAGDNARADTILSAALKQFPHSGALKLRYAQNLEDENKPAAMRNYLLSQPDVLDTYPAAQQLLARGAGQQNNLGEAYYRQARYFAMLDDYPQAINQLRTALQTAKLSAYDRSRLRALRDQMVTACHRAWSQAQCRRGVAQGNDY